MENKLIDFHTHILQNVDDGSENIVMSVKMLNKLLTEQKVAGVVLTPHYLSKNTTVNNFLALCENALDELKKVSANPNINLILGSEVFLEKGLNLVENIEKLCISNTEYIMLELPYCKFENWMVDEIYNVCYKFKIKPIIAHFDRYISFNSIDRLIEILNLEDAVFQINCASLQNKNFVKILDKVNMLSYPIVLGTDCHNLTNRQPNFDIAFEFLNNKKNSFYLQNILETQNLVLKN